MRLDIPAVSYWAAVPHYVAQPPCPKATLALLGQLEDLLEVSIPLGDLPEDARAWERGVDELAEEDEDIADYVRALEETRDTTDLPEASGEAIAREFERYLKRRREDSERRAGARLGPVDPAATRPRRARRAPANIVQRGVRVAGVGQAVGAEGRGDPGVDRGDGAWGVEVVGQGGEHRRSTTGAAGAPAPSESALRQTASVVDGVPQLLRRSTPSRCGSGGAAAPAGSPSGRRRCCAARRRRPGCPGTSTSSRRRSRPCRRARRPARTACRGRRPGPRRRTSRGAGRPGRCRRPGRRRRRRGAPCAIAVHSMCQPGRPGPNGLSHAGSPGRSPRQTTQSSGSFLPARSGSPPRSGKTRSISSRSSRRPAPNAGSAVTEK